ncbi:hypothetical protein [Streptomyces sp. NRRL F-5123]|uniref:hypothetical protein n=1 Tax=Streptomyces sp. NRRL F-5123 TaxID=1463856 RepID=UPI0004E24576|nr:hypothetical protein [Streptomyces sp. NRRL F-5123]
MLEQALAALAASGGAAVVTAAGTDAWTELRARLARWFGRGSDRRETVTLERLDTTAAELEAAPGAESEVVRERAGAVWTNRIRDLLEDLDAEERTSASAELRTLLAELPVSRTQVGATDGSVAAGRDVTVRAEGANSVAAAVIRGDVHLGVNPPPTPDASQG